MVAMTDLKTAFGSRFCMTALVKTFSPKISPGFSVTGEDRRRRLVVPHGLDRILACLVSTHRLLLRGLPGLACRPGELGSVHPSRSKIGKRDNDLVSAM